MLAAEPHATALILAAFGLLLGLSILFSRTSARLGVPIALVFLLVGVVAGSEGLGKIPFEDYHLAFRLGTIALIMILFDGGLNTRLAGIRLVAGPAVVLATIGVAVTAGLVAVGAHLFGMPWPVALLFGAIVSSTDAAAVFSVLTASGTQLKHKLSLTLEVESGLNDPMAVLLTTALTAGSCSPARWRLVRWRSRSSWSW